MSEPIRIAIVVDGAGYQVLSAGIPVEFVVVDYDSEGDVLVHQGDGREAEPAWVSEPMTADIEGAFVLAAHAGFTIDGEC